uniref:dTDP-D-glucose 4,6-dehydratase n=1 Tax=Steinernema glaseri TaxID=37863 RepID=A0A1I7YQ83_9BILA
MQSGPNHHQVQKVLITGGCGFIGSNFINYVFDRWPTASFVNFDKLAWGACEENIPDRIRASDRYVFIKETLLNERAVIQALKEHHIDTVIHFAAVTHVDESYSNRMGTIEENVMSTTALIEAINADTEVRRFVHISTDEVYGDSVNDSTPKTEESLPNPTNPYAASKAACEQIIRSYWHSYKLPYVMVRMNNVYGPRQALSKLIPKFTRLALEGKPYPLMGDGQHTRSWMFVDDCAEAILRVTERGALGETYNIGTDFEKSNLALTELIHELVARTTGAPKRPIEFAHIADRPYHDRRYFIDFSKIRSAMDWQCSTPFEEGLRRTIQFYVEQHLQQLKQKPMVRSSRG